MASPAPNPDAPEQPQQPKASPSPRPEHLQVKVSDNNNEIYFKIKRTTLLKKVMDAFAEKQGKDPRSVRFFFDGVRVNEGDSAGSVSLFSCLLIPCLAGDLREDNGKGRGGGKNGDGNGIGMENVADIVCVYIARYGGR
jgi:hypothetical protein